MTSEGKPKVQRRTVPMRSVTDEVTPIDPIPLFHLDNLPPDQAPQGRRPSPDDSGERVKASAPSAAPDVGPSSLANESGTDAHVFEEGEIFRGRRIVRFIDAGGFGEVYEALTLATGRSTALKVLARRHASRRDVVARLTHEANVLKRLGHVPNVVRIDAVEQDPRVGVFLEMELLRGRTLRAFAESKGGRLSTVEGVALLVELTELMVQVHDAGVFHRDLKPENVFLETNDQMQRRLVLLDLGTAKTNDGPSTTSKQITVGTWPYISPEHLGYGRVSGLSDQYSLGCMGYELFEGQGCYAHLAQQSSDASNLQRAWWHLFARVQIPSKMPVGLWNIIGRTLEKDPELRYPSMTELGNALRRFLARENSNQTPLRERIPAYESDQARPAPAPVARLSDAKPPPKRESFLADPLDVLDVPSLVIIEGPEAQLGWRYALGTVTTIGRHLPEHMSDEAADIVVDAASISKHHCRLQAIFEDGVRAVYQVDDLDSRYGTALDGLPIPEGLLSTGGRLSLGRNEVVFELRGPDVSPRTPVPQGLVGRRPQAVPSKAGRPPPPAAAPRAIPPTVPMAQRAFAAPVAHRGAIAPPAERTPSPVAWLSRRREYLIGLTLMVLAIVLGMAALWRVGLIGASHAPPSQEAPR